MTKLFLGFIAIGLTLITLISILNHIYLTSLKWEIGRDEKSIIERMYNEPNI